MRTPASADLGKILKQRRVMIPMTLKELARATGISASHLARIEKGNRLPSGHVVHQIAEPMGFEEDALLILAGFKSPKLAEKVEARSVKVDPYVARILSKEPVEIQRAVVAILTLIRFVARQSREWQRRCQSGDRRSV